MLTHYAELLEIRFLHGYFRGGVWNEVEIYPTPATCERLNRSRCLWRTFPAGVLILAEVASDGSTLKSHFTERLPFSFFIRGPVAKLTSVTEGGSPANGTMESSIRYFNNLASNGSIQFRTRTYGLLRSGDEPFVSCLVPRKPLRRGDREAVPGNTPLEAFDVFGNSVWNSQSPPYPTVDLNLDLSSLPESRYQLKFNGGDPYDCYLSSTSTAGIWGVVDIFPGGPAMIQVPEECRIVSQDGSKIERGHGGTSQNPALFAISVEARKSFVRYFVFSSSSDANAGFDDYEMTGGSPGLKQNGASSIAFKAPTRQSINGRDAWVFETVSAISLYEVPGDHYAFKLSKSAGGSTVIPLPFASAEDARLEKYKEGQIRFVAETFVYL